MSLIPRAAGRFVSECNDCVQYNVSSAGDSGQCGKKFFKTEIDKDLRSAMSQVRLNGFSTLSIERDIVSTLDNEELIEVFATKKARKVNFR